MSGLVLDPQTQEQLAAAPLRENVAVCRAVQTNQIHLQPPARVQLDHETRPPMHMVRTLCSWSAAARAVLSCASASSARRSSAPVLEVARADAMLSWVAADRSASDRVCAWVQNEYSLRQGHDQGLLLDTA